MSDFSLYTWDVSSTVGKEYVPLFEDLARFLSIQITIQALLTLSDSQRYPFWTADFLILILYLAIGILFYGLVFKRIVAFK
jgi:hypothetical protein